MTLFIGLMSGTSLDGVDGVLVDLGEPGASRLAVKAHRHRAFDAALRGELLALNSAGPNELHRAALAANALARSHAAVTQDLLAATGLSAGQVRAVGAHGQTVRHQPGAFDGTGYTLQLFNGALLAELVGIDVVCDLRSRDIAAGGQGAPLVPAFHAAVFGRAGQDVAVLNIGGIANLSLLAADGQVRGFDCGPGNALLDHWCQGHTGAAFDDQGRWGATGRVDEALLQRLLAEPFFDRVPPKSTGRDLFNPVWLQARLADHGRAEPADVMATLVELSARSAADALRRHQPTSTELLVCGGGAFNTLLMQRLAMRLPGTLVRDTTQAGLPPLQVEATAFAWLAQAFVQRQPGNRPEVTGATGPRVLGALYPAG
ncbi:molecular chaperone [Burkholderiales bacterium JOSHI_001]|nr:molecular chaperone [Burkholderiales bacterium JOSHI_001]